MAVHLCPRPKTHSQQTLDFRKGFKIKKKKKRQDPSEEEEQVNLPQTYFLRQVAKHVPQRLN